MFKFFSRLFSSNSAPKVHKEHSFLQFFEESSSVMLLIDPENERICNANKAALCYYGYPLHQLVGMSINVINTLSPEKGKHERQQALNNQQNYFTFKHRLNSGALRDVEVYVTPVYVSKKALLFAIVHDITARKVAEDKLTQMNHDLTKHEILFKQILDTSSVAIFLVNLEGRITQANHCMSEMFLYSLEELSCGKEYVDLIHPSEREIGRQKMLALLGSKIPSVDLERIYCRADGTSFWGRLTGKRFYDERGNEVGLVGVIADIDERKYTQQCEQHHAKILQMITLKSPLNAIFQAMIEGTFSIHRERIELSILLFDENQSQLHIGTSSSCLLPLSEEITQITQQNAHFTQKLIENITEPILLKTLQENAWWHQTILSTAIKNHTHCFAHPIVSATQKGLGFLIVSSYEHETLTQRELKFINDEIDFAILAIEKNKDEIKLQLAASVFTYAREGIIITDEQGTIIEVNQAFTETTGYSKEEILGQSPRLLKSGKQEPLFYQNMWQALRTTGYWQGEIWNRRKNGEVYAEILTISAIKDSNSIIKHFVALFTDITTIKEHEKHLEYLAHHDPLTNLPNRMLLSDRLFQAIAHAQRYQTILAVLYIDIDGFKEVNDTYGHTIGDALLVEISQRILSLLRKNETIARLGGDEFVALLTDIKTVDECEPFLIRLLDSITQPINIEEKTLHVSASIGVSFYPLDTNDADRLIENADQAMYIAKQTGKNRFYFFKNIP